MQVPLNTNMFLKGGILMGLVYDSPRQTADIDLTTSLTVDSGVDDRIRTHLDSAFPRAAAALGYAGLLVKVHSVKRLPKKLFETARFPGLKLKITSARRGTRQEKALNEGRAALVIDVDISFNEQLQQIQVLNLTDGQTLYAYGLVDLIAEKYRAVLQQIPRQRNRRQDIYDLDWLIANAEIDDACRKQILDSFLIKCRSRDLEPTSESLNDPEIKTRSAAEWATMALELGEAPDFEPCFACVLEFYRSLPW